MGRVIEAKDPMKKRTTKARRGAAKQERGEIVLQPDCRTTAESKTTPGGGRSIAAIK